MRVGALNESDEALLLGDCDAGCVTRRVPEISDPMLDWMGHGDTPIVAAPLISSANPITAKTLFIIYIS